MTKLLEETLSNPHSVGQKNEGCETQSNFSKYPEYKESGVDWLGLVPEHWGVDRIKALLIERNESNCPIKTTEILSLCMYRGVIPYSEKGAAGNKAKEDLTAYKLAYPGDIVLNSMNVVAGSVGLSKYFGAVSPVYYMLRPRNTENLVSYFNAIFQDESFQKSLVGLGNGILVKKSESTGKLNTIRMRIPMQKLNMVQIPCPTSNEQLDIINFLDYEVSRINALINEQQRLIKLLKEKRQAVISRAVTKGLDPMVPMKDSGVEWLGEVPAHWRAVRLRHCLVGALTYGANEPSDEANLEHPRYIRITDLNDDGTLSAETYKSLPPEKAEPYMLEQGDVLFARSGATVGKSFLYSREYGPACYAGYLIRARVNKCALTPMYLWMCTQSRQYEQFIGENNIQATIQNVSAEKYGNMWIALPEIEEQEAILAALEVRLSQFKSLIETSVGALELLQERRSALISAAVTGKIDVRGWQPPASASSPELAQEAV